MLIAGQEIDRVVFALDGEIQSRLRAPNSNGRYRLRIKPTKLIRGKHRAIGRVTFSARSGAAPATLSVTFTRCRTVIRYVKFAI